MNSTETPRQETMQVRQPPHQSIGPYLLPEAAPRCTATDVVAILILLLSSLRGLGLVRRPRAGAGALRGGLAHACWEKNGATFHTTGVQLGQDVSRIFECEL